jgi:small subunit ribosomal protein S20
MANHASAKKRDRQRIIRTARNKGIRSRVRHALKSARAALEAGDAAAAKEPVQLASVVLARAVSQGVLHKNTASRTISRVQSALAKLG